jgi:hypothetical protein
MAARETKSAELPGGEQLNGRFGNLISKDNKAQHF